MIIEAEELRGVVTASIKPRITDEFIDELNQIVMDDAVKEQYRENLISLSTVLREGKFSIPQYTDAVRFVTYKLLDRTNVDAYKMAFPDRYKELLNNNTPYEHIVSYASAYSRNKLVVKILEQSAIPTHILNADIFQKAINVQANIMNDPSASFKVRSDAANSLLTHLKAPEAKRIELDIGIKQSGELDELRKATQELVEMQKRMMEEKIVNAKDIAESKLIEGEYA